MYTCNTQYHIPPPQYEVYEARFTPNLTRLRYFSDEEELKVGVAGLLVQVRRVASPDTIEHCESTICLHASLVSPIVSLLSKSVVYKTHSPQ